MSDPFFDTNILIDWLSGKAPAIAELSRYRRHRISRIVWMEVLAGESLEGRDILRELIAPFEVVEIDVVAHVLLAGVHQRLVVPAFQFADGQGLGH